MKISFILGIGIILVVGFWLMSCDRKNPTKQEGTLIQPGGIAEESEQWGYLSMRIVAVHEKQKALDAAPWFEDGGNWTFLECETEKDSKVRVLIGNSIQASAKTDLPTSWGEARIAVADAAAGGRFVETFAKAFHQPPPASYGQKPGLMIKMHTAALGTGLVRDPHGGFKEGRNGSWVATKWFLQDETAEAEVFFNFSTKEKRAEFSEKDEGYREDLIQQLVLGLRDGPLPERTLENDPSLTTSGPTVTGWNKFASSNEICQFSHDGHTLLITTSEPEHNSQLSGAPIVEPANRKLLAEFEGSIFVQAHLTSATGMVFVVSERVPKKTKTFSTSDTQRLWFVDPAGKKEISMPAGATNWFVLKDCISPDARFVGVGCWEMQTDKKRARVIYLTDVESGKWQKISLPATVLDLVGWTGPKPMGVVLTGGGGKKNETQQAFSLDPVSGRLTPLNQIPREFTPGRTLAPDGIRTIEVIGREKIVIADSTTGLNREFVFHPYDRHNVYPDSIQWATDRYLVFQSSRTSLINVETLKMNYPTTKESGFDSVEFSPDFKWALGHKVDGIYLGRLKLPAIDTRSN
ncbi:MAG: hypothetical protein JWN25_631 [Verrucomicrobiales bacterium]|nr:hypothetical protein [Verrucomicrobiales bacterium]